MNLEVVIIGLLLVISAVAAVTRYLRVPYPVALVITGLGAGALLRAAPSVLGDLALDQVQLTPRLVLTLLLPALLFEATLHIEARTLRRTLVPISLLAIPGVVLAAAIVGALVHWGVSLDWGTALLFGALVAATDPVAVLAIFKRIGAPRELELLVEGESIFNDGTAVVLANILKGAVLAGTFSIAGGSLEFLIVVGGGMLVGLLTGAIVVRLLSRLDDHLIEITLTTILTYGTYILAESVHVSGVIAVVAAGLVLANVGAKHHMSPTTRLALLNFWEYVAFLVNSVIFLLIGLQVNLLELSQSLVPLLIAVFAVLLSRAVVVYGLGLTVLPLVRPLPREWLHVIYWAAPRGAVSLAVVLALPMELPARALLVNLTFGVVLFTLLAQTLTMERLLLRLGITGADAQHQAYLARRAQLLMIVAAERELARMAREATVSPRVHEHLSKNYKTAAGYLETQLEDMYRDQEALVAEELRTTRTLLLRVERTTLLDLQRDGMIDSDTAQRLLEMIDARLLALPDETNAEVLAEPALPELNPALTGEEGTFPTTVGEDIAQNRYK